MKNEKMIILIQVLERGNDFIAFTSKGAELQETTVCHDEENAHINEVIEEIFEHNFDFTILPGWMIERLPPEYADLVINMRSMMEMSLSVIDYYFHHIHRITKVNGLFACFNRYHKNSFGEDIIMKKYPYDEFWSIILSQSSIYQNHIHELILKREDKKNSFPVSERLKSLPPF